MRAGGRDSAPGSADETGAFVVSALAAGQPLGAAVAQAGQHLRRPPVAGVGELRVGLDQREGNGAGPLDPVVGRRSGGPA